MKRRATKAEQRLRKERDALRRSSDEHAEELSDALARAELAEQRLGEQLKQRKRVAEARLRASEVTAEVIVHCQNLTDALAAVEARGARHHERGKAREAALASRESAAADAAIKALRELDSVKQSELILAGALQRATRVVKWSAESRRLGAALAARADGCSTHDANSSSPGGTIDAPGSAVVGVGTAS